MIPVLYSNVPLSFWGGIDPETGIVIDTSHPLWGKCISGTALCLPGGRGSSTGSQTMLELILNGTGPAMLILQRPDPILCTGAIVAEEFFSMSSHPNMRIPRILILSNQPAPDDYSHSFWGMIERTWTTEESPRVKSPRQMLEIVEVYSSRNLLTYSHSSCEQACNFQTETSDNNITLKLLQSPREFSNDEQSFGESHYHFCDLLALRHTSSHHLQLSPYEQNLIQISQAFKGPNYIYNDAEHGSEIARAMAMKTLVRIALLTNATSFIPISRAHIDACTYIGPGGLQFAQTLARLGGRVVVPATTNSSSVDRTRWKQLGTPSSEIIGNAACAVQDAYIQLGCIPTFSCAPYLPTSSSIDALPPPHLGEQMAWGESNAVVYANSVLGARTEKYADYMDICAAIVGRVPNIGVHTDEERLPNMIIDLSFIIRKHILPLVEAEASNPLDSKLKLGIDALYPVLGWLCGNISRNRIPLILGMELLLPEKNDYDPLAPSDHDKQNGSSLISLDDLKAFCAAFGTTATAPLFHMAHVTPEAKNSSQVRSLLDNIIRVHGKTIIVTSNQLNETYRALNHTSAGFQDEKIELIALGNPHFSLTELRNFVTLYTAEISDSTRTAVPVTVTLSRDVYNQGMKLGLVQSMQDLGVQFVNDTCWCMLLDGRVLPTHRDGIILTNSGKYASYGPGLTQRQLRFGSLRACVMAMRQGHYPLSCHPAWVSRTAQFSTWVRRCVK